jgi:hypothetical protein
MLSGKATIELLALRICLPEMDKMKTHCLSQNGEAIIYKSQWLITKLIELYQIRPQCND